MTCSHDAFVLVEIKLVEILYRNVNHSMHLVALYNKENEH